MSNEFSIRFDDKNMFFVYNGQHLKVGLDKVSDRLKNASEQEINDFRISHSGYGIHWHKIDEDLSFAGLAKTAEILKYESQSVSSKTGEGVADKI